MRLIDADSLMEKAYWHGDRPDYDNLYPDGVQAVDVKDIEDAPTVDPVAHGHWIWNDQIDQRLRCSVCGFWTGHHSGEIADRFCCHCGSRMDE